MSASHLNPSSSRLTYLDRAKGFAILLVVVGHLVTGEYPKDNEWMQILRDAIYLFHMPFFMFISGFIMFLRYKPIASIKDWWEYISKRFVRLMPAYFLFALLVPTGKLIAEKVVHVDNPVRSVDQFIRVILEPTTRESPAQYLWYVYVLFLFYLSVPIMAAFLRNKIVLLAIPAAIIYFVPTTTYFAMDRYFEYLLIFILGGIAALNKDKFSHFLDSWYVVSMILFFSALVLSFVLPVQENHYKTTKLALGLLSVPALLGLVRTKIVSNLTFLSVLGNYVFPIYLMNTICIGIAKAIMLLIMGSWDGPNFFAFFLVLLASGLFIPIAIRKYLFARIKILDKITA